MSLNTASVFSASLYYADMGYRVVPVRFDPKVIPLIEWRRWASRELGDITHWWDKWPDAGVALTTGGNEGLLVVDQDVKSGVDGIAEFYELAANFNGIPVTPTASTPSGGLHHYFSLPRGVSLAGRVSMAPGVDIRADGNLIVAPPSVRHDGAYAWIVSPQDYPFAEAPEWLIHLVGQRAARAVVGRRWLPPPGGRRRSYILSAVEGEARELAEMQSGGRNNRLFRAAATLGWFVVRGHINEGGVINTLVAACDENGLLGERGGQKEVSGTIKQGLKAAQIELEMAQSEGDE